MCLLATPCVTLSKSFNLSGPHFPHFYLGGSHLEMKVAIEMQVVCIALGLIRNLWGGHYFECWSRGIFAVGARASDRKFLH